MVIFLLAMVIRVVMTIASTLKVVFGSPPRRVYRQTSEARKTLARCRNVENVYLYIVGKNFMICASELPVGMRGQEASALRTGTLFNLSQRAGKISVMQKSITHI